MLVEIPLVSEEFSANLTRVWLFPGVCSPVLGQMLRALESLSAKFAFVRFVAGVRANVPGERLPGAEGFVAECAAIVVRGGGGNPDPALCGRGLTDSGLGGVVGGGVIAVAMVIPVTDGRDVWRALEFFLGICSRKRKHK